MATEVCVAGATGWAGSALARAVHRADDLEIVSAVSRTNAGRRLGDVLDLPGLDVVVAATAESALTTPCHVFVEYTKPDVAKGNVLAALDRGAHVVVGTSGLTDEDYREIDDAALRHGLGVLAVGNFALTVVLLQKLAEIAARHVPHWEIIDYAHAGKADAPSGTARELAHRLAAIREPQVEVPLDAVQGGTGGPRGEASRHAGSLGAPAWLCYCGRGRLRHERPEADPAP